MSRSMRPSAIIASLSGRLRESAGALLHGLGWNFLARGRPRISSFLLRCAVACAPDNHMAWLIYGHGFKERQLFDRAQAAFRMARRRGADRVECDFHIGLAAAMAGDKRKARRIYNAIREHCQNAKVIADFILNRLVDYDPRRAPELAGFRPGPPGAGHRPLFYDITNLIASLGNTATGIQRVQMELLRAAVGRGENARSPTGFVFFHTTALRLVLIDASRLLEFLQLDPDAPANRFEMQLSIMDDGASCEALPDIRLVNLGLPAEPHYFEAVDRLRRINGWKLVSLVHDCLPLSNPEFFQSSVTEHFHSFLRQSAICTDMYITSTGATRTRLIGALRAEGAHDPRVSVVPFANAQTLRRAPAADEAVLSRYGLAGVGYVLFVSTIEIRKNHRLALDCWKSLAARHGADAVPHLLLVGTAGWLVDDLIRELDGLDTASTPVRRLTGVGDAELDILYRNCLFTLYPSLAEGWGLPVSESLSWFKPVLASSIDVIREAGGDLVDYADPLSVESFVQAAERLIFDAGYRKSREDDIRAGFVCRAWSDVADDIDRETRSL